MIHEHLPMSRAELTALAARPTPSGARKASLIAAAVGLVCFIALLVVDPDRAWRAWHYNWLFFATLSTAGVTLAAVQRVTTARWSRHVIRFIEGYVAFLPIALVFLILTMTLGYSHVFPWAHVAPPVAEKRFYFQPAFFIPRVLILFALLVLIGVWFIYTSVRLDVGIVPESGASWARGIRERMRAHFGEERRELHSTHSLQGRLAVFAVLAYACVWIVLAWDLSMGLDMHFQSTMYGWWYFMTGWIGALSAFALLTVWWRKVLKAQTLIGEHQFHDIGKLCFAFTVFWGYITFGQYMVIWYGNMAEEAHWTGLRFDGPWQAITTVMLVMTFVVPFFGLLFRSAKVYIPTLVLFTLSSVIGTWLQRYIEVYPSLYGLPAHAPFGLWEIGVTLFYLGVWGTCYFGFMDAFPKFRVFLMTSPYRDEVQVPVDPKTMRPLAAHE